MIRDRLGLGWEEGPENLPAKCVQAEKRREYLKFAQSLIEVRHLLNVYPGRIKMHTTASALKIGWRR